MNIGFSLSLILLLSITGIMAWSVLIARTRAWYEFMPSIFWQSLMAGSFVYQYHSFDREFVDIQAFSIGFFSVTIFISDWVRLPKLNWFQTKYSVKLLNVAYILVIISVGLQLSHLYFMPEIPLVTMTLDKIKMFMMGVSQDGETYEQAARYMKLRESASKLLDVPLLYIYVCQATLLVFAPFAIHILIKKKKWILGFAFLLFCVFYSRASLAKGTIYLFTALMLLQVWFLLSAQWRKRFVVFGGGAATIFGAYCTFILMTHPSSIFRYKAAEPVLEKYYERLEALPTVPRILTNADHGRLFDNSYAERAFTPFEKFINFLAYRVFFVPTEVSHFWYVYYPKQYGEYLSFYGLSPSSRNSEDFVHPANRLGLWAYRTRFPTHYFDSVRAYCSIDADAHARWGLIGIFGIAFLLFLMRIIWKMFRIEGRIGTALYASLLFVLGSALPAASFFAILLANGVFMYFVMLLLLSIIQLDESF